MITGQDIEDEIQERANKAPRVTPDQIEEQIVKEYYGRGSELFNGFNGHVPVEELGTLTICILVLRNGFTVVGHSACASPENYDREIGRKVARANAVNQIWPLEGYALRSRLIGN